MRNPRKQILIIDDHASIRMLLGTMLSKEYAVTSHPDGLLAMQWLNQGNRPDLILLDLQMPRLDGKAFLRLLRASGYFRDIPTIVISGDENELSAADRLALRIDTVLPKPFNPISLRQEIDHLLLPASTI